MQNLRNNWFGVEELTDTEMNVTSGGISWLPAGLAVALIISAINNAKDIREGFMDGFQGKPPRY